MVSKKSSCARRITELFETAGEATGQFVDPPRNSAQTIRPMINRVHRGHDGKKNLGGANVARRFVAPDVLLARLQRKPVGRPPGGVMRNADQPPREMAFVLIARRDVGGVRTAEA